MKKIKLKMKSIGNIPIEASVLINLMLSFSGGFQDAYTYLIRDHVFANAQTGNIVLASNYLMIGEWKTTIRYILPIIAFVVGILLVEMICCNKKKFKWITWKQFVLLIECFILFCVGFLSQEYNLLANILISFSCAMQVQTFRKLGENIFASTMCIGNIRSGAVFLSRYLQKGESESGFVALKYLSIVMTFGLGAGACSVLVNLFLERTIWVCAIVLCICFVFLFKENTIR